MIPPAFWIVTAGFLGLAIGSFLNVVVHRVPAGLSVVSPPSRCPDCETAIRGRHNVPVLGWLMLRGRCYDCHTPISPRYPLVEAATGVLFAAATAAALLAHRPELAPAGLLAASMVVVGVLVAADGNRMPRRWRAVPVATLALLLVGGLIA